LDWPPYSPDLNPVEYIWLYLKQAAFNLKLDVWDITGGPEHINGVLSKVLLIAWWLIKNRIVRALVNSIKDRVEVVYQAKGWHTKYQFTI
ncbi:hypothetical protein K432DRAFT_303412, partial [Lepidopterella palustris CBS 459.81]